MFCTEQRLKNGILTARHDGQESGFVPAAVSNSHVHLDRESVDALFGKGYELQKLKDISQPGQYACNEFVTLEGPKRPLKLRVLGPLRNETQVELSATDARGAGIAPVVRLSGDLKGTPGALLKGPVGAIKINSGVIVAARHLHLNSEQSRAFGLRDGDRVRLAAKGERGIVLENVIVRAGEGHELDLHIDFDEANSAMINNGDLLKVVGIHNDEIKAAATMVFLTTTLATPSHVAACVADEFGEEVTYIAFGNEYSYGLPSFRAEGNEQSLTEQIAQCERVLLIAPDAQSIIRLSGGKTENLADELVLRALLWEKPVHIWLDFSIKPRHKSAFFRELFDAVNALEEMGAHVRGYQWVAGGLVGQPLTFVTEHDIMSQPEGGELVCTGGAVITPLARDKASQRRIRIRKVD